MPLALAVALSGYAQVALLSSWSLLLQHFPAPDDRHEYVSWGRAKQLQGCGSRAWVPWPACPPAFRPKCKYLIAYAAPFYRPASHMLRPTKQGMALNGRSGAPRHIDSPAQVVLDVMVGLVKPQRNGIDMGNASHNLEAYERRAHMQASYGTATADLELDIDQIARIGLASHYTQQRCSSVC